MEGWERERERGRAILREKTILLFEYELANKLAPVLIEDQARRMNVKYEARVSKVVSIGRFSFSTRFPLLLNKQHRVPSLIARQWNSNRQEFYSVSKLVNLKKKKKMDRQMGTKTLLNDNLVENVREKRILRYVVVGRTGLNCAPRELSFNSKNSGDRWGEKEGWTPAVANQISSAISL